MHNTDDFLSLVRRSIIEVTPVWWLFREVDTGGEFTLGLCSPQSSVRFAVPLHYLYSCVLPFHYQMTIVFWLCGIALRRFDLRDHCPSYRVNMLR